MRGEREIHTNGKSRLMSLIDKEGHVQYHVVSNWAFKILIVIFAIGLVIIMGLLWLIWENKTDIENLRNTIQVNENANTSNVNRR